jgi:hypothetical protein
MRKIDEYKIITIVAQSAYSLVTDWLAEELSAIPGRDNKHFLPDLK